MKLTTRCYCWAYGFSTVMLPALLAASLIAGCFGGQARQRVLLPAIKAGAAQAVIYADQSPDVDTANVERFRTAVEAGDSPNIKAEWPGVYASALDTIARRTDVSEAVKVSLREPLKQTDAAIGRLKP